MKKGLEMYQRQPKEAGVCAVALPHVNALSPLQVCFASLIRQLEVADPETKVEKLSIAERWIRIFLSKEKVTSGATAAQISLQDGGIICSIPQEMNVAGAIVMLREMSQQVFVMQYKHRREDIEEMKVESSKWTIRTKAGVSKSTVTSPAPAREKSNVVQMPQEALMCIDGANLLSRCFFATSHGGTDKLLKTSSGKYTNAVYGMIQSFFGLIKRHLTANVVILWDVSRTSTWRRLLDPNYKAHRGDTDPALKEQFETAWDVFSMMGVPQFRVEPFEADDLIGMLSARWSKERNAPCYIVSNDRDLYQLLNENVSIIRQQNGKEIIYKESDFEADYGIKVNQWIDAKALEGDTGDNIPGVSGVGEKAVFPMLQQFGNIEGIYQDLSAVSANFKRYVKKLEEGKENAFLSKILATIVTDPRDERFLSQLPTDIATLVSEARGLPEDWNTYQLLMDKKGTLEAFKKYEFGSLLEKIS